MDNHIIKSVFSGLLRKCRHVLFFTGFASSSFPILAITSHVDLQNDLQNPLNSVQIQTDRNELNKTQDRVSALEAKIKELQVANSTLTAEMKILNAKKSGGMSFEVWTGILLACAALLLTILGIGIALLSVFGYRKIVKSSSESAQKIAVKVAQEISVTTANEATSTELQRLIAMGAFNAVIREAIETISYRGLQPLSELDDQEA